VAISLLMAALVGFSGRHACQESGKMLGKPGTTGPRTMQDYTKMEAWKLADDLTVAIYGVTRAFPREELYGLTNRLRRAAYSAPGNIVEGSSRESKRDCLHFLYIARGSLSEAQSFIRGTCKTPMRLATGSPSIAKPAAIASFGGRGCAEPFRGEGFCRRFIR
jgi:four helix bundle protein